MDDIRERFPGIPMTDADAEFVEQWEHENGIRFQRPETVELAVRLHREGAEALNAEIEGR